MYCPEQDDDNLKPRNMAVVRSGLYVGVIGKPLTEICAVPFGDAFLRAGHL